ncbi:tRNA (adenosine(37)-N6)-threonylcarbamoyltransferase complex dimerization subunit type 1 TsaB [Hymenobacter busanensis]|uniref:tRNA (Adenosine(37)-N6)-threonylcarbamoyltransferase complex dimerization subunit type 1 TsaB n=1 Tax=Hymenobacter busanensis TaxID=2607656 RepID=A0A7L5A015_9BACT|nr:tRNA (adenosine(37)-N6)-threonylcarbamoyltransferase complex dimerization subunit type 1 TsaB [Hymenobacter busanensis]KAA9325586.1 tRNA (adenosine(37)-N6)-threonylcarbamoyltransferase complex dimerization subunit type 1 TsaB [Hymenobacter busanensis]QHJ07742.1 tRNA (adenosine(37)-N6)-threonylcarbamoyltransferase complex dimerization subunit type 1 TsaB [Hymenobacter busanensis]
MPLLLALETSSPVCSVALTQDGALLASAELRLEKSHSSHLTVLIEQLVANAGFALRDLAAVAVADGPGSYTGLRIGAAAAKGLCYALEIPLIAIGTLPALAHQVARQVPGAARYRFAPLLDARRMEVYAALYAADGTELLAPAPLILEADSFAAELAADPVVFFGSGATKFQPLVANNPNAAFLSDVQPSAIAVAQLAEAAYARQDFRDVAYYEPFYLKEVYTTTPKSAG